MPELAPRTIGEFGISAETLMENAGQAVVRKLKEVAEPGATVAVSVVCSSVTRQRS